MSKWTTLKRKGYVPQVLFGFERVHVRAGESATVWLYPSLLDFSQVDGRGRPMISYDIC